MNVAFAAAASQESSWIPIIVCFAVVGTIVGMAILMGRRQAPPP